MCLDPMTIATIAATAVSINAQNQNVRYQNQQNQRQYDNTIKAMAENVNQTNREHMQEREGAMQKLEQNNLNARSAEATAITAAGENGVSGLSVGALLDDLAGKQGRFNDSVTTNYQNAEMALDNQRANIGINAANTINNLKTPTAVDYASAGLRIGDRLEKKGYIG